MHRISHRMPVTTPALFSTAQVQALRCASLRRLTAVMRLLLDVFDGTRVVYVFIYTSHTR